MSYSSNSWCFSNGTSWGHHCSEVLQGNTNWCSRLHGWLLVLMLVSAILMIHFVSKWKRFVNNYLVNMPCKISFCIVACASLVGCCTVNKTVENHFAINKWHSLHFFWYHLALVMMHTSWWCSSHFSLSSKKFFQWQVDERISVDISIAQGSHCPYV